MFYNIEGLCPQPELPNAGFSIRLWPAWQEAVKQSDINQTMINHAIQSMHRMWLDSCGYDTMYDPDLPVLERLEAERKGKPIKPGPNAHPLYGVHSIRIQWGDWGPEHITVPGDACGLDIDRCLLDRNCRSLTPHNVDCIRQAHLLLVIFTWIAGAIISKVESDPPSKTTPKS